MTPLRPGRATDLRCGVRAYYQETEIFRFGVIALFGTDTPALLRAALVEVLGPRVVAAEIERGLDLRDVCNGQIFWNRGGVARGTPRWSTWQHTIVAAFRFRFLENSEHIGCLAHECDHIVEALTIWNGMDRNGDILRGEPRAYLLGWLVDQLAHGSHVKILKRKEDTMACKSKGKRKGK